MSKFNNIVFHSIEEHSKYKAMLSEEQLELYDIEADKIAVEFLAGKLSRKEEIDSLILVMKNLLNIE